LARLVQQCEDPSQPGPFWITECNRIGQAQFAPGDGQPGSYLRERPAGEGHGELNGLMRLGASADRGAEPGGAALAHREAAEPGELTQLVAELIGQVGGDLLRLGQPRADPSPAMAATSSLSASRSPAASRSRTIGSLA